MIVDTKEARRLLVEASRASDTKDFDKVEALVRNANESINKNIPSRMNDEMKKAKDQLLEAKMKNVNITPLITILKSVTSLMKAGDFPQAVKEMREFKEQMKKSG
jgi:cellobiose-specific phosphotransferase system component IIA